MWKLKINLNEEEKYLVAFTGGMGFLALVEVITFVTTLFVCAWG